MLTGDDAMIFILIGSRHSISTVPFWVHWFLIRWFFLFLSFSFFSLDIMRYVWKNSFQELNPFRYFILVRLNFFFCLKKCTSYFYLNIFFTLLCLLCFCCLRYIVRLFFFLLSFSFSCVGFLFTNTWNDCWIPNIEYRIQANYIIPFDTINFDFKVEPSSLTAYLFNFIKMVEFFENDCNVNINRGWRRQPSILSLR